MGNDTYNVISLKFELRGRTRWKWTEPKIKKWDWILSSWLNDTRTSEKRMMKIPKKKITTHQTHNYQSKLLSGNSCTDDEWPSFATKLIQPNPLSINLSWIISQTSSRITSANTCGTGAKGDVYLEFINSRH